MRLGTAGQAYVVEPVADLGGRRAVTDGQRDLLAVGVRVAPGGLGVVGAPGEGDEGDRGGERGTSEARHAVIVPGGP